MNRRTWLLLSTAVLVALVILGLGNNASASIPTGPVGQQAGKEAKDTKPASDGFDQLASMRGVSMGTLVSMGVVHPQTQSDLPAPKQNLRPQPNSPVTWGLERNSSGTCSANEPAATLHPTDPLRAITSGNWSIDASTDGGATWTVNCTAPFPSGSGDVVHAWTPVQGDTWVLGSALNSGGGTIQMTSGRSTNNGQTWVSLPSNIAVAGRFNDRQYLWTDTNPSSPFYGRTYVTFTLFDSAGSGSFNTTGTRFTTDGGTTWSAPFLLDNINPIGGSQGNKQFASIAVRNNGYVYAGWMDVRCCGAGGGLGGDFNKFKWSRSTDGGVTFPISGTAGVDTAARSVIFNDNGPAGFRWSPQASIGVDPADGTIYMIWLSRRVDSSNVGVAVKMTRSTDQGATWSTPAFIYNDPQPNNTQYMPWVVVSDDHAVHVTYSSSVNNANNPLAHFYVQSTDQGNTWSAPFQLSTATYNGAGFHGDYQASHLGARVGATQSIIASWTDNRGGTRHYARIGSFIGGTPTPTVTGTPPTATRTSTPTRTFTASPTVCGASAPYSVATATGTIVAGTTDIGNHADDLVTTISLPFSFRLYDQTYTSVNLSSNGNAQFVDSNSEYTNDCLPSAEITSYAIFPLWDDQRTDAAGSGIFTSVSGSAPNRIFNIEWRTTYFSGGGSANYVLRLYEDTAGGPSRFDVIYGAVTQGTTSATLGVQRDGTNVTQYACNGAGGTITAGTLLQYRQAGCGSPGPSSTPVSGTPTSTPSCTVVPAGWTAGPNHPASPGIVRAVGVYFPANGKFYTVGGRTSDAAGSDTTNPYEFTPGSPGTWVTKAGTYPDNEVNNMACAVLTQGGTPYIYCVGGSAAGATTATARVFRYNPVTDTVSVVAGDNWPGNASGDILPGGFAVVNNKLYIVGGFQINIDMVNGVWEYDPNAAGSHWTAKANMPVARGYVPATAIGGMIYTAGGSLWDGTTLQDSADSFKYDPVANTWTAIANTPRATGETRALALGGMMYVLGGGRTLPNPGSQVDVYNPGTNTWSTGTAFVTPRRNFPTDTDGTRIWLAGGYAPTTATNTMEIYSAGSGCGTATPTVQVSATSTTGPGITPSSTRTTGPGVTPSSTRTTGPGITPSSTSTVQATPGSPTATATACVMNFTDVAPSDWFYEYVQYLYCHGVINGYNTDPPCNTGIPCFKPGNTTTRGQLSKIVVLGFQFPIDTTGGPHFSDVPPGSTFYDYIETLYNIGAITGYTDGTFRPDNWVTRGQITKIIVLSAIYADPDNWQLLSPPTNSFEDVPVGSAFFDYIETAFAHDVITGYPCDIAPAGPCVPPDNKPYFLPYSYATRAQISKVAYLTITYTPPRTTTASR